MHVIFNLLITTISSYFLIPMTYSTPRNQNVRALLPSHFFSKRDHQQRSDENVVQQKKHTQKTTIEKQGRNHEEVFINVRHELQMFRQRTG